MLVPIAWLLRVNSLLIHIRTLLVHSICSRVSLGLVGVINPGGDLLHVHLLTDVVVRKLIPIGHLVIFNDDYFLGLVLLELPVSVSLVAAELANSSLATVVDHHLGAAEDEHAHKCEE